MNTHRLRARAILSALLKAIGVWRVLYRLRAQRVSRQWFLQFKRRYGNVLQQRLNSAHPPDKIALITGVPFPEVVLELGLIKALELAGFVPVVVLPHPGSHLPAYYRLAAVKEVHLWREFADPLDLPAAEAVIDRLQSLQELLTFEYEGARVGNFAVSTALRHLRRGSLGLQSAEDRRILVKYVAAGLANVKAAQRIVRQFRPALAVFVDRGYMPKGELFDTCLMHGVDAIEWGLAHKHSTLMIKRYHRQTRDEHLSSLSSESWRIVQSMEWTDAHRERLEQELYSNYANGDWYSVAGTQIDKELVNANDVRKRLGVDPMKKTVFIFPHISWDATLFWGESLFENYEAWFIETVRAACVNKAVNWVIKIHPAHVGKGMREGFRGEPAEMTALRQYIGALPPHIHIIPAESDISTYSLFGMMDYCVTVRGTVGIEAARLGIPVLTAGTGRYDHKDFTIDSESREHYLERIARIQEIPRLSAAQRELAERFAYGLFVLRPLPLTAVTLEYHKSQNRYSSKAQINIRTKAEWYNASDLQAIADWVAHPSQPDFLISPPDSST